MTSAAAKSCQGDSSEFYIIIGDEVLKLKNFKKDDNTSFQDQEKYEHIGPKVTSTQDGKRSQDDDKRLYSADDLKMIKDDIQVKLKGTSSSLNNYEVVVNISKRRAFWSLNEDILKITILKTNTPYPSRKIRRIRACTHQRPQRNEDQYAVSR
ncbi:hypothetical protein Tco_0020474 [Tanacetum coccineum]